MNEDPPQAPLAIWSGDGTHEGYVTVRPEDEHYAQEYARARRDYDRYGIPMPYAAADGGEDDHGG